MYVNPTEADTYFSTKLQAFKWLNAPPADKTAALSQATQIIDRLNFRGIKTLLWHAYQGSDTLTEEQLRDLHQQQPHEFPRDGATTVPAVIKTACCEIAKALLDGYNPDDEHRATATVSENVGPMGIRSTFDRTRVAAWTQAGVPSPTAWHMLLPFLRDPADISIRRA